jgi:GNAT superfamily N-acetyltransferase
LSRIRLATPADAEALARLRYALRSKPHDIESTSSFAERCRAWMTDHLQHKFWRAWVLEENDQIIGALWLQLIEKIPNPTAESELMAYITNVFVNEDKRGKGLGSTLLAAALEFCQRKDIKTVILWPSQKSRTLYERHGFAVREDLMELELDG